MPISTRNCAHSGWSTSSIIRLDSSSFRDRAEEVFIHFPLLQAKSAGSSRLPRRRAGSRLNGLHGKGVSGQHGAALHTVGAQAL